LHHHIAIAAALVGVAVSTGCAQPGDDATEQAQAALIANPTSGGPSASQPTYACTSQLDSYCYQADGPPPLTTASAVQPYMDNAARNWGCTYNQAANAVIAIGSPAGFSKLYGTEASPSSSACGKVYWNNATQAAYFMNGSSRGIDVALGSNGATVAVTSTYNNSSLVPAASIIDGDEQGIGWAAGTGGWSGWHTSLATNPDWLTINFGAPRSISEIDVFTLPNSYPSPPSPPVLNSTLATTYGITNFQVLYYTGSSWQPVPNGNISGNGYAWRQLTFAPITTSYVQVRITGAANTYARVVEVEAWDKSTTTAALLDKYNKAGAESALGLPTSNPVPAGWTGTTYQLFDRGVITSSPVYGTHSLGGPNAEDRALADAFKTAFGLTPAASGSPDVYPLEIEPACISFPGNSCTPGVKTGAYSKWKDLYWNQDAWVTARTGDLVGYDVPAKIATAWVAAAWPNTTDPWASSLGLPLSRLTSTTSLSSLQQFQGGAINWSPPGCVKGAASVATAFVLGAPFSAGHAPVPGMICDDAPALSCNPSAQADFAENGIVPGTGKVSWGCARDAVGASGWFDHLVFEGTSTSDGRDHTATLQEPFLSAWLAGTANCVNSKACTVQRALSDEYLKRPTHDAVDIDTGPALPAPLVDPANHGQVLTFEGGNLYKTPDGKVFSVEGPLLSAYLAAGGPAVMGYPLENAPSPGIAVAKSQAFQHGTVNWNGLKANLPWWLFGEKMPQWISATNVDGLACNGDVCPTRVQVAWSPKGNATQYNGYTLQLLKSVNGGAESVVASWDHTMADPGAFTDAGVVPWSLTCYRLGLLKDLAPFPHSPTACVRVRDGRNIEIQRAQIKIAVDGAKNSGTDAHVWVNLGDKVTTYLDSNVDDFLPGSTRTYDLSLSHAMTVGLGNPVVVKDIRYLSDISALTIGVKGNDDICITSIAVDVNMQDTTTIGGTNTDPSARVFNKVFNPPRCVNDEIYSFSDPFAHVIRIDAPELATGGATGDWGNFTGVGGPDIAHRFTRLNATALASVVMARLGDKLATMSGRTAYFEDNGQFSFSVVPRSGNMPLKVQYQAVIHIHDAIDLKAFVGFNLYFKEVGCTGGPKGTDLVTEFAWASGGVNVIETLFLQGPVRAAFDQNTPSAEPFPFQPITEAATGIDPVGGMTGLGGDFRSCAEQGF
jgi:hypothetical protein